MRNNRKDIYNALLAQLKTILTDIPQPVQTISRVWRPHTDYAAAQMPAILLDEKKEHATVEALAAAPLYHLYVDLWIYLLAPVVSQTPGQETEIPMDALDDMIDILENGGMDVICHADKPELEDTFLLGPNLINQLKQKRDVMRAHWRDAESYMVTPLK